MYSWTAGNVTEQKQCYGYRSRMQALLYFVRTGDEL